ncbi:MAG: ParB N-terminal domain-containing protein [Planctomycetota bacterium]|nr:ParB N-terminal domain-containing protein [Planctomycetota bacterium]
MKVTEAKLSEVKQISEYLRQGTDVEALKKSLESVGLINPVTVNDRLELLAGARRVQAARELGWETIAAQVVDRASLEQELISIDENLVRAPLTGLELERSLNRGREIYESLNPEVTRVELTVEEPKGEERKAQAERDEQDEDSFAAVTSEKTGLSKAVIKSAIKRDALAAEAVKAARSQGDINATQTNELIKLGKDAQAEILPLVADRTVKEVKRIVAAAQEGGLEAALEESRRVVPLPREFRQILGPVKRVNRNLTRILVEELRYHGPEREQIHRELRQLRDNLEQYLRTVEAPA